MSEETRLVPGYHRLEVIYRGESSTIYRGLPEGTTDPVAIKVLRDSTSGREIERLSALSGAAGVVSVLGQGRTTSGREYVVLPFHGADYAARLTHHHPLPVTEVVSVAHAASDALSAIHDHDLLHHGVEPGNLLQAGDSGLLTDFGSAAPMAEVPEVPGPDPYEVAHAPPEALRGDPPSPASDVYRLASTVWTLLAGHLPFMDTAGDRVDPFSYRDRALTEAPPRVPRADVPEALRRVVDRAMALDPADRFATAAAFGAELDAVQNALAASFPSAEGDTEDVTPDAPPTTIPETQRAALLESAPAGEPGAGGEAPDSHGDDSGEPVGKASPPSPAAIAGLLDEFRQATGTANTDQGGRQGSGAPPEDAWASLPGWSGSTAPPAQPPPRPAQQASGPPGGPGHGPEQAWAARQGAAPDTPPGRQTHSGWPSMVPPDGGAVAAHLHPGSPTPAPPPPPDYTGIAAPARQRPTFIAVAVIAITFLAVTAAAVALLRPGLGGDLVAQLRGAEEQESGAPPAEENAGEESGAAPQSGEESPPAPPAGDNPDAAPTEVEIVEDSGHEVTLSWTDNTSGAGSHHIIGGQSSAPPENLTDTDPGESEAVLSGLNGGIDYCFTVIAVLSVDEVARSEQVCTSRDTDVEST